MESESRKTAKRENKEHVGQAIIREEKAESKSS